MKGRRKEKNYDRNNSARLYVYFSDNSRRVAFHVKLTRMRKYIINIYVPDV